MKENKEIYILNYLKICEYSKIIHITYKQE